MSVKENAQKLNCKCYSPPFNAENYEIRFIGTDNTNNRYAEVSIYKCKLCNSLWVNYFYENDYAESGRWFKGSITEELSESILPEQVPVYLEELDEYFYGGSFFKTLGKLGNGKLHI